MDGVLIVGGGIGGLALAGALGRGVEVHVVDNQPEWAISRAGIALQAPALRALRALGLLDGVVEQGFGMTAFRYHDATGTKRAESELPRLAGPEYPGTVGILRQSLHAILLAAAEESGAEVRLGTTVQSLDGAEIELSDGTSAGYDLLVGADGIRSRVRELGLRRRRRARVHRRRGVARADGPAAGGRPVPPLQRAGRDVRLVPGVGVADVPVRGAAQPEFGRVPAEDAPALMRELLSGFGGLAGELREGIADPELIVRRPVEAILVPPPWHRGRTVLIGDAVHAPPPTLAAGAAIVLEDAVVLDEMLAGDGRSRDVEAALAAFVERRFERCRLVVEQSVARTRGIVDPTPDFDVAAFERRIWGELAKPY